MQAGRGGRLAACVLLGRQLVAAGAGTEYSSGCGWQGAALACRELPSCSARHARSYLLQYNKVQGSS